MEDQFIHNLETDKLELHFSKSAYKALSKAQQGRIKSYFLFSKYAEAWVSKGKVSGGGASMAQVIAKELNLEDGGTVGEKLGFVEQQSRRLERAQIIHDKDLHGNAQARLDSLERSTTSRNNEIDKRYPSPWITGPSGYPANKLRKRAELFESNMRNFIEMKKRYEEQLGRDNAQLLRQIKSPVYLNNRLVEATAELRSAERANDEEAIDEAHIKITYYNEQIAAIGGIKFTKEVLKAEGATHVMYHRKWYPIVRLNDKTVTFGNWLGINPESTWNPAYAEIQNFKVDWETAILPQPGVKKAAVKKEFKKGDMALFTSPYHNGLNLVQLYSVGPKYVTFRSGGSKERLSNIKPLTYKADERVTLFTENLQKYVGTDTKKILDYFSEPARNEWPLQNLQNREPYRYVNSEKGNEKLMLSDLSTQGYSSFQDFFTQVIAGQTTQPVTRSNAKEKAKAKLRLLLMDF